MNSSSLPLSSFEHLMLSQDSPAYPCVVYCRMDFHGKLDRNAFTASLRETFERHPLFRSRVQRSWRGIHWAHESSDSVPIHWLTSEPEEDWTDDSRLDLYNEVGTRIYVHDLPDRCTLVFQCHHACADGLGVQTALDDLWQMYDRRTTGTQRQLPPYDPALLPSRNRFGMSFLGTLAILPKQMVGLLGVRQYLMRNPVPIIPHKRIADSDPPPLPASCHVARIDRTLVKQLRRIARENEVSLHELLTCSIFRATSRFRKERGYEKPREWIRMMVPVNMRATQHDKLQTACNIVSSIFLDRTPSQIEDRKALVQGIHEEMELIKRNRLGLIFIASLWFKKQWPFGRSLRSSPQRCQTSLVVTNVGRSFASSPLRSPQGYFCAGNLSLESITMLAPMTPFMSAAITINEYGGDLFLALRYDPRVFDRHDARELLDLVVIGLKEWSADRSNPGEV